MTRMNLVAIAALAGAFFGLQPAQAYEAPWCAVIQNSTGSVYWDCQYSSFEQCYRKGQYFGRQPWHLQSEPVLYRQRCRTHALSETPRSPAVAAAPDMSLMSGIDPNRTPTRSQIAKASHFANTTRVPTWTRPYRSMMSLLCMRTQPADTRPPIEAGLLVPWMASSLSTSTSAAAPIGFLGEPASI